MTPVRLPPPAVFTHDETLHRIPLPPLALFLNDLSAPDQLIKLNDVLTRFRTPKSYHRVDVRLVESSELPPDESGEEGDAGRPVILPEQGAQHPPLSTTSSPTRRLAKPSMKQSDPSSTDLSTPPDLPVDTDATSQAGTNPPDPLYPLPPSTPTRRIRELRLDLRTLDAAALFALETWRRELLGLDKLPMDHPDSIWYKEPSPTPTPVVAPAPSVPSGKRRGRPRKSQAPSADRIAGGTDTARREVASQSAALRDPSGHPLEPFEPFEPFEPLEAITAILPVDSVQDAFGDTSPAPHIPPRASPPASLPTTPLPPSPDVILDDLYDRRDEADPDFIPRPAPRTRRRRGRPPAHPTTPPAEVIDLTAAESPGFKPMKFVDISTTRTKRLAPLSTESTPKGTTRSARQIIESVTLDSLPGKRRRRKGLTSSEPTPSVEEKPASHTCPDDEWGFLMDI
ncbi:hypothetical protein DB88DRAFT_510783 [Papiliotrema laurentii]|uniref:Uncharacterized protein n=1 Tax=Papiliotrema laurentii TaxID=5418 RepID=A0AAD9CYG9_PAPLA|nr:hypothetical protein DB88DRAFT_510783 [Papiliotrema laurentii]